MTKTTTHARRPARRLFAAAAATTLAALALPAAAGAHVTLQPKEAPAGGYTVLDVRVPNEKDDAATTKVQVRFPAGVSYAATQAVPGWKAKVADRKPQKPFDVEGEAVTKEIDTITWTADGDGIEPGQFQDFPVSLRIPDQKEGSSLSFPALQTYAGGDVVRWIGAPESDEPAPVVTVDEAEDEHGGAAAGDHTAGAGGTTEASTPAAAATAGDSDDDDTSTTLPTVLGIVGVLLGAAGLGVALTNRRRTA